MNTWPYAYNAASKDDLSKLQASVNDLSSRLQKNHEDELAQISVAGLQPHQAAETPAEQSFSNIDNGLDFTQPNINASASFTSPGGSSSLLTLAVIGGAVFLLFKFKIL